MSVAQIHPSLLHKSGDGSSSAVRFPWGVFALSLLAFPITYALNLTSAMRDSRLVFLAGVVICTGLAPLIYSLVRRVPAGRDVYFYVFCVFAFTSLVDLVLALSIDGVVDWMAFYCREGEVYLTTPHGLWINVWDGSFHYACYLLLAGLMLRVGHSYSDAGFRRVGLVWAGSILNSLIVLLAGSAVGLHAPHIKPSYLLNIPYALFPAIFLYRIIEARPAAAPSNKQSNSSDAPMPRERKPLWSWLLDLPLLSLLFFSASLCVFRLLVVLRSQLPLAQWYGSEVESHLTDSAAYPTLQMLTYAFLLVPYLCAASVRVWNGVGALYQARSDWLVDWSLVALGALLQGSFSYMLAAARPGRGYPAPEHQFQSLKPEALAVFLGANLALLTTPALVLLRMAGPRNRKDAVRSSGKKEQ